MTETEHYWAWRALHAEAELQHLRSRSRSILGSGALIQSRAGASWALAFAKFEKVVVRLFCLFRSPIVYLQFLSQLILLNGNSVKHHLITFGLPIPSHFTIPILSPFTSVVRIDTYLFF